MKKLLLIAALAVFAACVASLIIQDSTKDLHGIQVSWQKTSWQEPSFQTALTKLKSQHSSIPLVLRGYVWAPRSAEYMFALKGSMRCRLAIDGAPVIMKGLLQRRAGGRKHLAKGEHLVELRYFATASDAPMELRWSSDLATASPIPSVLSYAKPIDSSQRRLDALGHALGAIWKILLIALLIAVILYLLRSRIRWSLTLAILFLAMAALRFSGIGYSMPEGVHPDERLVDNMVFQVRDGRLRIKQFWYTTGYVYVSAAADETLEWIYGEDPPVHAGQRFISAIASSFSCLLVFLLARRFFGNSVGIVAAIFFGFSFMPVYLGHFGIVEPFLVFLFLLTFLWLSKAYQEPKIITLALSGLFAGMAVGTKQTALILALPMVIMYFLLIKEKRLSGNLLMPILLWLVTSFAGYFLLAPFTILEFDQFYAYQIKQLGKLEGATGTRLFFVDSAPSFGTFDEMWNNMVDGVGIPMLIAAAAGGVLIWFRSRAAAWLIVPLVVIYVILNGSVAALPYHYGLLLCPFIAILAALVVDSLKARWKFAPAVLIVILLAPSLIKIWKLQTLFTTEDTRRQASKWCYRNLQNTSRIDHELFGPRFLIPVFDPLPLPLFKRGRLEKHLVQRLPQYYIEDSLSMYVFRVKGEKFFPMEYRWFNYMHKQGTLVQEFRGKEFGIYNPHVKIYKLPELKRHD